MKLPNPEQLIVEREKVVGDSLDVSHRYGASKARFFVRFGFWAETGAVGAGIARAWAKPGNFAGQRDRVRTALRSRRSLIGAGWPPPRVRSVWQFDRSTVEQLAPRLDHGVSGRGGRVITKEDDLTVLTRDLPEEGLTAGDVGTVVHVHEGGRGYGVEFMTIW